MLLNYRLLYCRSRTFSTHSLLFQYPGVAFAALTSPPRIVGRGSLVAARASPTSRCSLCRARYARLLIVAQVRPRTCRRDEYIICCNIVNYSLRNLNKHK